MLLRLVLWNLADSKTTIDELRRYLRDESVDQFEEVPGLRFKAWISDEVTERWGAVYLWESAEAARQELPFDVEATIEGAFAVEELSRRVVRSSLSGASRSLRSMAPSTPSTAVFGDPRAFLGTRARIPTRVVAWTTRRPRRA